MLYTKFQPNISSGSEKKLILAVSLILATADILYSHSEALQPRHAACAIREPWVQWFQRISHVNGLKCHGCCKFC